MICACHRQVPKAGLRKSALMKNLTYQSSGVNISKADEFVRGIKGLMRATMSPAVLKRTRAFGSLFSLGRGKYRDPVLVSSADGVGTKLLIAQAVNKHDTVGIDLVAMNVNDVLCVGARPLFFLDYIACGKVRPQVLKEVVRGIAVGCRQSQCCLIGGETAEMPGLYASEEYDLAGFAVGIVEKNKIIDGSAIRTGDSIIGLCSSGLHSNGYSLVRKVLSLREQRALAPELLRPTKIYVREVLNVVERYEVHGIAHVTGGAFYEKMTKVLPPGLCLQIKRSSWKVPAIFQLIQNKGRIEDREMFRTFNMGIGMVMIVPRPLTRKVQEALAGQKIKNFMIGEVIRNRREKIRFVS